MSHPTVFPTRSFDRLKIPALVPGPSLTNLDAGMGVAGLYDLYLNLRRHRQERNMVPDTSVAAFSGFAAQAKSIRFEIAGASALHTPSLFCFNPGDATGTQGIGVYPADVC